MKIHLLGCVSLVALSVSAASSQAAPAADTGNSVQEVVVTAQKRSENIQNVPVTVAVVSSKELAERNIVTTSDLVAAVPALTVTNEGVFQIRSLGTQGFARSAEQSVSVVVDGVAMPRPQAYVLANSVFDLDHVEVLSGPQGTLFGKNSNAGVINIVTHAPVLGQFGGSIHAGIGEHDYTNIDAVINVPLGSTAAFRLTYNHDSTGHIVYNTVYNKWDYNTDDGFRGRLLWKPRPNLTVNVIGDYQLLGSNGVNAGADFAGVGVFTYVPPGSPLAAVLASCGVTPSPTNNRVCGSSLYAPGVSTGDVYGGKRGGASVQVDWNFLGDYTLTSITGLRQHVTGDFDVHADIAGNFGDTLPASTNILKRNLVPSYLRQFSEELRLASPPHDRINYVVGAYYAETSTKDTVDQAGQLGLPLGPYELRRFDTYFGHLINYAAFGQINFDVTSKLRLLAGGRVTHDDLRELTFNSFPDAAPNGPYVYTGNTGAFSFVPIDTCVLAGGNPDVPSSCPAGTDLNTPGSQSTTGYNWKLGVEYHFNRDTMTYFTVSRGYKGPFFNDAASWPIAASQLIVKAEKPLAFEIGAKTTLFDRLKVDIALFDDKTSNFQTTIYIPPVGSTPANFIQGNAPYALSRGVDLSVFGQPIPDLSLNGDVLYDDARFNPGFLVNCASGPCPAVSQLPYAPVWKATFSGEYRRDLTNGVQGFLQSDITFSSKYPYGSAPPPTNYSSGSRFLLGLRAGARIKEGRWSVAVFCRNCLDERYPVNVMPDLFAGSDGGAGPPSAQTQFLSIDSYRVVGVDLDARF